MPQNPHRLTDSQGDDAKSGWPCEGMVRRELSGNTGNAGNTGKSRKTGPHARSEGDWMTADRARGWCGANFLGILGILGWRALDDMTRDLGRI